MLVLALADRFHKMPAEIMALPFDEFVELIAYCRIQAR
jgi:hypothetical protein